MNRLVRREQCVDVCICVVLLRLGECVNIFWGCVWIGEYMLVGVFVCMCIRKGGVTGFNVLLNCRGSLHVLLMR